MGNVVPWLPAAEHHDVGLSLNAPHQTRWAVYLLRKRDVIPWTSWMTSPWRTGRGGLLTTSSCLTDRQTVRLGLHPPACPRTDRWPTCRGLWWSTSCWRLWRDNRWPAAGESCPAHFHTWTHSQETGSHITQTSTDSFLIGCCVSVSRTWLDSWLCVSGASRGLAGRRSFLKSPDCRKRLPEADPEWSWRDHPKGSIDQSIDQPTSQLINQ